MGTLAKSTNQKHTAKKTKNPVKPIVEDQKSEKERKKIEKKLEKEYSRIRMQFEDIRQAYKYAEDADSSDDIYFRLLQLERTTRRVRRGGIFTRGAKAHRRLLHALAKLPID